MVAQFERPAFLQVVAQSHRPKLRAPESHVCVCVVPCSALYHYTSVYVAYVQLSISFEFDFVESLSFFVGSSRGCPFWFGFLRRLASATFRQVDLCYCRSQNVFPARGTFSLCLHRPLGHLGDARSECSLPRIQATFVAAGWPFLVLACVSRSVLVVSAVQIHISSPAVVEVQQCFGGACSVVLRCFFYVLLHIQNVATTFAMLSARDVIAVYDTTEYENN